MVELHDCSTTNELMLYDALGLSNKENIKNFIEHGDNTYGGKYVVNPSDGLMSKGHPFGATGLGQLSEVVWQLRGMSEKRRVKNEK